MRPRRAAAMSWVGVMTESAGVSYLQAPASIMLGGTAEHPPFHGVFSPRFSSARLSMDNGLHTNRDKEERVVAGHPVEVSIQSMLGLTLLCCSSSCFSACGMA